MMHKKIKDAISPKTVEPVKVYSAKDFYEAEMILSLLKNHQIPAYRQSIGSGGYLNIYAGNSIYGEDIFVNEKDAITATALIREIVSIS